MFVSVCRCNGTTGESVQFFAIILKCHLLCLLSVRKYGHCLQPIFKMEFYFYFLHHLIFSSSSVTVSGRKKRAFRSLGETKRALPYNHGAGLGLSLTLAIIISMITKFTRIITMITKIIRIMTHFHNHDDNHNHQVSGCSFRDTIELTKHAESLGVAAIGVLIIIIILLLLIIIIVVNTIFPL